jgi:hypothetical protein
LAEEAGEEVGTDLLLVRVAQPKTKPPFDHELVFAAGVGTLETQAPQRPD